MKFILFFALGVFVFSFQPIRAQVEHYSFDKNWEVVNAKNLVSQSTREIIAKRLKKINCTEFNDARKQCQIILNDILGDNFNCEYEYHLINSEKHTDAPVLICDQLSDLNISKNSNRTRSTGTSMRSPINEIKNYNDLEEYFSLTKAVFDSLTLNLPFVKPNDSLVVSVNDESTLLRFTKNGFVISKLSFKNNNIIQKFKLINLNDDKLSVKGNIHFISTYEEERILNYSKAVMSNPTIVPAGKFLLISNYASFLSDEYEFDIQNLKNWLHQKDIILN